MNHDVKDVISKLETMLQMECPSNFDQRWRYFVGCLWDHAIYIEYEQNLMKNGLDLPYANHNYYLDTIKEYSEFMFKVKELSENINLMSIQLEKMGGGTLPTESQVRDLKETCQAAYRCLE